MVSNPDEPSTVYHGSGYQFGNFFVIEASKLNNLLVDLSEAYQCPGHIQLQLLIKPVIHRLQRVRYQSYMMIHY
jgi:hypothetical protein